MEHRTLTAIAIVLMVAVETPAAETDSSGLHYPMDARRAAIFYSRSIELSDSLSRKIDSELVILRSSGFEQFVNLDFSLPWKSGELMIEVDSSSVDGFIFRKHKEWRPLAERYDLSAKEIETRYTYDNSSKRLLIRSSMQINSYLLAQKLVGMKLVNAVKTCEPQSGWFFDVDNLWARSWDGNKAHYYFMSEACPFLHFRYDYIEVANGAARHVGTHLECSDSVMYLSELTIDEKLQRRQAFIDSAQAARPVWMDTARSELRNIFQFSHGSQFLWTRDSVTK